MTTDASRSKLAPTSTNATASSTLKPATLKPSDITTSPSPTPPIKPAGPQIVRQPPPVPQTFGAPPPQKETPKPEDITKMANVRNQLFNDDANDSHNDSNSRAGGIRARPKGNITMSFEKKVGGTVKINHQPTQNVATLPPQQSPPSTAIISNPQNIPKPVTSPEVSAFNPTKSDSDKFRTVESSNTMKMQVAAGDDQVDRLQAEIVQLKTKIHSMTMEAEDKSQDYEARMKQYIKSAEQQQSDLRKHQDEKKELLIYKRDYFLAKEEIQGLREALDNKKDQKMGPHPDSVRLAQVQASIDQLQASKGRLEAENEDQKDRILKLEGDIGSFQQKLKSMAARESQLAEEISREKQGIAAKERAWVEEKEALTMKIEDKRAKIDRLTRELDAVKDDQEKRVSSLKVELEQMNNRILTVDDENSDLKERLRALEDDMEEKVHLNAAVQERQKVEKQLAAENNQLKQQVGDLNATIQDLTSQIKSSKEAAVATAQLHAGELQSKVAAIKRLEAELMQVNELVLKKEQELAQIEQQNGAELRKDREKVIWNYRGSSIQEQTD